MGQKSFSSIIIVITLLVVAGAVFLIINKRSQLPSSPLLNINQPSQSASEPNLVWSYLPEKTFNGKSDRVEFGKSDLAKISNLRSGTISVWFKFNKTQGKTFLPILYLGKAEGTNTSSNLVIEVGHYTPNDPDTQRLYYTLYNTNQAPFLCFDSVVDLKPDTWYHFVAVGSAQGNTGYLNGKEMTNRHYNFSNAKDTRFIADIPTKEVFYLGYGWFGINIDQKWHYFNGSIKNVKIYDKAMTSEEVAKIE